MRKIFSFLLLIAFTATAAHAQKKSPGKKHLNWGFRTGANLTTLRMDDVETDIEWRTRYVAGIFFNIRVNNNFIFQPEFLYSGMGGDIVDPIEGESTLRLNYFSIPVLAKYKFAKKWAAVLGPQFDFLIQAKQVMGNSVSKVSDDFRDNSINATAGFEFWPLKKVGFSARYIHGFTDIGKTKNNRTVNTASLKNQAVQLTVAVKL